eukprot:438562-Amphidinium_carterae.4
MHPRVSLLDPLLLLQLALKLVALAPLLQRDHLHHRPHPTRGKRNPFPLCLQCCCFCSQCPNALGFPGSLSSNASSLRQLCQTYHFLRPSST